ncbi:hypothetical protein [Clostridium sp.]|jgi:hypothetical protein|uniref:hypothetical protein n=1 Tax=Clostridium sp. TaxID=1506 RepID=UPI003EE9EA6B
MIERKNSIIKLLYDTRSLIDINKTAAIDVGLKEDEVIGIKCYSDKFVDNNFFDYKVAISMLYKNRKD